MLKLQFRYTRYSHIVILVGLFSLSGCAVLKSPQRSTPSPTAVPNETKIYRSLAHEQERRLLTCSQDESCDRLHFTRALIVLHDDPEAAAFHFREVITGAPNSRWANLSASWLKFLDAPSTREDKEVVTQTTQWLLLELLNREKLLRHELSVRDKKMDELSRQLKALKQINLEMKEKNYLMRPHMKTVPEADTAN